MEKIGFFTTDTSEAVQAIEEQVFKKKLMGGAAGLELCQAVVNPGLGTGLRRAQAGNRMDIPTTWRALVRPPKGKSGPVVSLLAPRGQSAADAGPKLTAAGVVAENMEAGDGSFDCTFAPDTPTASVVMFATSAVNAMRGQPVAEWQWTVRAKGAVPQ
jgi:hypothetical protein